MLSNFWQWSGGFAQYVAWADGGPIPYPPPMPNGSWDRFQRFTSAFYKNARAMELYDSYVKYLVPQLKANPTVIWELANEPRGLGNTRAFHDVGRQDGAAHQVAGARRSSVTTGSEGLTASPWYAGVDPVKDHQSPAIDFIVLSHVGGELGLGPRRCASPPAIPKALELAKKYINEHAELAAKLGKPLLLEEFGFPRDGGSFDPASPTTFRDRYFQEVYALVQFADPDDADGGDHAVGLGAATGGRRGRASSGGRAIRSSAIRPTRSRGGTASTTRTRR